MLNVINAIALQRRSSPLVRSPIGSQIGAIIVNPNDAR